MRVTREYLDLLERQHKHLLPFLRDLLALTDENTKYLTNDPSFDKRTVYHDSGYQKELLEVMKFINSLEFKDL